MVHRTSFHNTLNLKRITSQKTSLFKIFTFRVLAGHWMDTDSKRAANSWSRLLLDYPPTTARWTCTSFGAQVLVSPLPQQSNAWGTSHCRINFSQWFATVLGLLPLSLFCYQPPNKNLVAGNILPELSLISLSCRRMRTITTTSSSQSSCHQISRRQGHSYELTSFQLSLYDQTISAAMNEFIWQRVGLCCTPHTQTPIIGPSVYPDGAHRINCQCQCINGKGPRRKAFQAVFQLENGQNCYKLAHLQWLSIGFNSKQITSWWCYIHPVCDQCRSKMACL